MDSYSHKLAFQECPTIFSNLKKTYSLMGRQHRPDPITGTIDILTFYKKHGKYYFRLKSSLDKERVNSDKAFHKTRQNASCFGLAVTLAQPIYEKNFTRSDANRFAVWYPMRNRAQVLVREGVDIQQIREMLYQEFVISKPPEASAPLHAAEQLEKELIAFRAFIQNLSVPK